MILIKIWKQFACYILLCQYFLCIILLNTLPSVKVLTTINQKSFPSATFFLVHGTTFNIIHIFWFSSGQIIQKWFNMDIRFDISLWPHTNSWYYTEAQYLIDICCWPHTLIFTHVANIMFIVPWSIISFLPVEISPVNHMISFVFTATLLTID